MTPILYLIFIASCAVYVFGKWRDYSVSVSRPQNPEQTEMYRDADGHFDAPKFKRYAILLFAGFGLFALLALLSPYALMIPSAAYLYLGIEGWRASRL